MKFEYQDKIDKYIHGEFSVDERLAFEIEVESNEELHDQLVYTIKVKRIIKSRDEKLKKIIKWQDEDIQYQLKPTGSDCYSPNDVSYFESTKKRPARRFLYWTSGIAAVVIIGFFAIKPLFINQYYSPSKINTDGELENFSPMNPNSDIENENDFLPMVTDIQSDSIQADSIIDN